ncbi:hypothetical protein ABFY41_11260 [Acinetobacter haemolyticus]|uniref:hypothetical protein n=1 Tax=Acinetobacter haemolyticus TaxID=29430 RepID=UPI003D1A4A8E
MLKKFIFCCIVGLLVGCNTNQQSLNQSKLKNVIEKHVNEKIRLVVKDGLNRNRVITVEIKPEPHATRILKEEEVVSLINQASEHIGTYLIDKTAYVPTSARIELYDRFLLLRIDFSTVDYANNRVTNADEMKYFILDDGSFSK